MANPHSNDLGDIFLRKVKKKVYHVIEEFAIGLVESADHPVVTGYTRGNWTPSINNKKLSTNEYGYTFADILDAYESRTLLIDVLSAREHVRDFVWDLGDKVVWTNSVGHIIDLEVRRKFFDVVVDNAKNRAQAEAGKG